METIPQKKITHPGELDKFKASQIVKDYLEFVVNLQQSVKSKGISETKRLDDFKLFDNYQDEVRQALAETPPKEGKNRFGNIAFKDFHEKLTKINLSFVEKLLSVWNIDMKYQRELATYLDECYGNEVRIDYGTGHELNFMVFLYCLNQLKEFSSEQKAAVIHQIFYDYIFTMRKIQLLYNLEPAGSHGVWGLDDYHFLPFIFGGAELIEHKVIKTPLAIHKLDILEEYGEEFMYLNCINFIRKVKSTAPFSETSPILNDISGAASWDKVAQGMVKMYAVEVLGKYPVVQHLRFGSLFEYK